MFEALVSELSSVDVSVLSRRDLCAVSAGVARVRGALDALEIRMVAAVDELGDGGGDAESMLRSEARISKREAARRSRRAEKLKNMPNTVARLARGEISAEHADALARAAAEISEAEVDSDTDLLARAKARPADMAARDIRDWTDRRQRDGDRHARHLRQREARRLALFEGHDGMTVVNAATDAVTGEMLRARIDELADRPYQADGGRDSPGGRSLDQRRHDALMILVGVDGDQPDAEAEESPPAAAANRTRVSGSGAASRADANRAPGVRAQIVVVAELAAISGERPDARCEIPGVGSIPASELSRLSCNADLFGLVFSGHGTPLWHGRRVRTVTAAQWRTLVARDRGCVICAARPAWCEAHHLIEWAPPARGPTDIDNLALVCVRHHHELHDRGQVLFRNRPDGWRVESRSGQRAVGRPQA